MVLLYNKVAEDDLKMMNRIVSVEECDATGDATKNKSWVHKKNHAKTNCNILSNGLSKN